ncbi:putative secreted protein with PEP-CTERM sorting signal, partial [Chthoniobacter flavus]
LNAASDALGGGTVAPGNTGGVADLSTVGQLNATGAVTLGTASTAGVAHLAIEIGGTNDGTTGGNTTGPLQYDRVAMSGSTLTLNEANLDISPVNGFAYSSPSYNNSTQQFNLDGHIFFLITGASNVVGTFANQFAVGSDPNAPAFATIYGTDGQEFAISYTANFATDSLTGGNDVAIMAIPEPNSMAMLAGSLGMALGLQRFRRRRKA